MTTDIEFVNRQLKRLHKENKNLRVEVDRLNTFLEIRGNIIRDDAKQIRELVEIIKELKGGKL